MGTMKTKPIIFSSHMIKALLEGKKTQTRRILDNPCDEPPAIVLDGIVTAFDEHYRPYRWPRTYAAGEMLWVREAWHPVMENHPVALYRADNQIVYHDTGRRDQNIIYQKPKSWASPIHMPRWANRLTLEVTDVRVERVQDISEAEAMAEGLIEVTAPNGHVTYQVPDLCGGQTPVRAFRMLWDSIHGPDSWDQNPWIATYTFTVHHRNVDDLLAEREVTA